MHHIDGSTVVVLPEPRKAMNFTPSTLTMEQKLQLAIAWKAEFGVGPDAANSAFQAIASCNFCSIVILLDAKL